VVLYLRVKPEGSLKTEYRLCNAFAHIIKEEILMGKKKANGEGSICKRADGRYMARYTVNGSRKAVYGDSFEEARQKLNAKLYEIANGIYIEPGKDTVGKWLRDWLTIYALPTVKQSTYVSYEAYVRLHLDPELGNVKLTALTTEQIQLFFKKKAKGSKNQKALSPKSLKNIYNMFHNALEQAVTNQKLNRNPILGVKLPAAQKKEVDILDPEEQTRLHKAVECSEELAAFGIIFTLSTGVRLGELIGLQWADVNFRRRTVKVRRTVGRLQKVDENGHLLKKEEGVRTTEIVIRSPKSLTSQREIPLFEELWDGLMAYREKQRGLYDDLGVPNKERLYIFSNAFGKVYDPRVYEDLFKRTLKAAGLEYIKFHALRHTFATRALEAGMDVKVLSTILGHSQASTTLNLYGHALPDHKRISMEKMRGFYGSADTNADMENMDSEASVAV